MQNWATNWNTLPAEKPLPCHMARKTPRLVCQQLYISQLSVSPICRNSPPLHPRKCLMQGFAKFAPSSYRKRKSAVQVIIWSPSSSSLLSSPAIRDGTHISRSIKNTKHLLFANRGIFHLLRVANSTIYAVIRSSSGARLLSDPW